MSNKTVPRFRRRSLQGATSALFRNAQAHADTFKEAVHSESESPGQVDYSQLRRLSDEGGTVNAVLKAAGFNVAKVLTAVSVAIDFAAGRTDWFTAPDKLLGQRLTSNEKTSDKNLMKAWSRQWRKLKGEQERTGVVLVERQAGGRDERQRKMPSLMRVPLLILAARTGDRAERMPGFNGKRRGECLEQAAREVLAELPRHSASSKPNDRFRRPATDDASMNTREIRSIVTLAKRVRARVEKNSGDSVAVKVTLQQLLESVFGASSSAPLEQ
jgi:hypothetical protein